MKLFIPLPVTRSADDPMKQVDGAGIEDRIVGENPVEPLQKLQDQRVRWERPNSLIVSSKVGATLRRLRARENPLYADIGKAGVEFGA